MDVDLEVLKNELSKIEDLETLKAQKVRLEHLLNINLNDSMQLKEILKDIETKLNS